MTAFVNDIIDPMIGYFFPAGSLETMSVKVTNLAGSTTEFKYGDLISTIIDFIIIAFIVFLAYKQLSKYRLVEDKTKPSSRRRKEIKIVFKTARNGVYSFMKKMKFRSWYLQ